MSKMDRCGTRKRHDKGCCHRPKCTNARNESTGQKVVGDQREQINFGCRRPRHGTPSAAASGWMRRVAGPPPRCAAASHTRGSCTVGVVYRLLVCVCPATGFCAQFTAQEFIGARQAKGKTRRDMPRSAPSSPLPWSVSKDGQVCGLKRHSNTRRMRYWLG